MVTQNALDLPVRTRKSETVLRLLLIFGSVVLAALLFLVAGWAGLVDYRTILSPPQGDPFANTNLSDPELIHIHPPHFHASGELRGGDITGAYRIPRSEMAFVHYDLRYDRNGFRNPVDLDSAGTVVIGDSFVESIPSSDSELISARLAQIQGEPVANLGQYDYGPVEELAVLRRYALPLHPRTVVWMYFEGNDLSDVARYDEGGFRSRTKAVAPQQPAKEQSFFRHIAGRIRSQLRTALPKPSGSKRAGTWSPPDGTNRTVYFRYQAKPFSSQDEKDLVRTAAILKQAQELCAGGGCRILFVLIPVKFRALRTVCHFSAESECARWTLNDLPKRLRNAVGVDSPDVGFLDLTPLFADAASKGRMPYYTDDDHWSAAGQQVAAEAVAGYIASHWAATALWTFDPADEKEFVGGALLATRPKSSGPS